jgi:hypothetical protein
MKRRSDVPEPWYRTTGSSLPAAVAGARVAVATIRIAGR